MMDHLSGGIRSHRPEHMALTEQLRVLGWRIESSGLKLNSPESIGLMWHEVKHLVREDKALSGASLRVLANGMTFVKWNLTEGKARRMVTVRGEGEAEALASALVKLLEE